MFTTTVLSLLALSSVGMAQTYTSCNPTNTTCSPDVGLCSSKYTVDFTAGADSDNWSSIGTGNVTYTSNGAEFTISEQGDSPTIETNWYFFYGRVEVIMKAATGTGIVSSVVIESDDLDEVDWEWLGGDNNEVQTDYFGKGNTTAYDRGGYSAVTDSQGTSHNYTIDWSPEAIVWYIDGNATRTLNYADAVGGKNFPQTPSTLRLGIWAGGDPSNAEGTIEWAGGETDYTAGPFTMYVTSVTVYNTNPASSYTYSDLTGDSDSITFSSTCSNTTSSSSSSSSSSESGSSVGSSSNSTKTSTTATVPSSTSTSTSSSSSSSSTITNVTSGAASYGASFVTIVAAMLLVAGLN